MRFGGIGSEQSGWRPGVIFSNNMGNAVSPNVIALPMTTAVKKLDQPTHVAIKASDGGLLYDSVVLCENPERMSKERVGGYITTLSCEDMKRIAEASLLATSAISYLDLDDLEEAWRKSVALNAKTE